MKLNTTDWEHLTMVIVLAIAMAALAVSIMLVAALWIQMGHPL